MGDDNYNITGCHGTIAPQQDEAYYDDRSDASDDMEKGRLKFPTHHLYGRERELDLLQSIYTNMVHRVEKDDDVGESIREETEEEGGNELEERGNISCVFLGGYSGIGKSALVYEFIKQTEAKHKATSSSQPILFASGKYTEQSSASVPFSAITEVLDSLAAVLSDNKTDEDLDCKQQRKKKGGVISQEVKTKLYEQIKQSELIGSGTEGNRVLRKTFPALIPLLDSCEDEGMLAAMKSAMRRSSVHPSMNAIKESVCEILSIISNVADKPLVLFLDDWQWADDASFDMMIFLLSNTELMRRVMFICAYRSNEIDADHSFTKLMDGTPKEYTEKMDLFSLTPDAITRFIADSVKKEEGSEEVGQLSEVVYEKTMGNIFFTMQALEELIRKNILFYDVMCFEWRWVVKKVELANYMSDDVVESVKGKLKELPTDVQHLLIVMSYVPHNNLDVIMLSALLNHGERHFDEKAVRKLVKQASEESMLMLSVDGSYKFAHDRIRQASVEYAAEENQDFTLPVHISQVLLDFAERTGPTLEWALFVAVDLLNSLPSDKTDRSNLIQLNLKVAKLAQGKGSREKENELLRSALFSLRSSGIMWKGDYYDLTLELYNAAIESDFSLGKYDDTNSNIDIVLRNANSIDDMLTAYMRQLLCKMEETADYSVGVVDGLTILNKYGFDIPKKITKAYIVKEEMKLKMAMKGKSYGCLKELPKCPKKYEPMFLLLRQLQLYAQFSGNEDLVKIIVWKTIQFAIKHGMGRLLPTILAFYAIPLAVNMKIDTAQELGNVALAMTEKISSDVEIVATTKSIVFGCVLTQLQPFKDCMDHLLRSHKDLKLVGGDVQSTLGAMHGYFECYFAAGLELGPLIESKMLVLEDYAKSLDRQGFATTYQIQRQFALNLRKRMDNPTEFKGEAFDEEVEFVKMNDSARKMALRDSSSMRLELAFVFWDEDVMLQMLDRLKDYPIKEMVFPRLYSRLCFVGLAIHALSHKKEYQTFAKLGKSCLSYFADLTKHGSVNAKPVHLFMLAMKNQCRETFTKAIDACAEAGFIHLEAMAKERFAVYLIKQNDEDTAKDYITSCYWLYQDWGAHGKAWQLLQEHSYLKSSKRRAANSATMSTSASSEKSSSVSMYSFNTTFKSASRILAKKAVQ